MISPALSTMDGVAQVQIFGSQKYAVRVQLDPDALAARGIVSTRSSCRAGSREIGVTIMSITVLLVAVFIPVLLMGGIIGRIFNEFAVVVTVAILASAFVSLTLTPMLAAKILSRPERGEAQARWSMLFERGFGATLRGYDRSLKYILRHQPMMLLVFLATLLGTVWLVFATPKGFFPQEDIGQLSVSTEARQDISFAAMVDLQQLVEDAYRRSPHVANVASIIGTTGGSSGLNNGRLFVELKPH